MNLSSHLALQPPTPEAASNLVEALLQSAVIGLVITILLVLAQRVQLDERPFVRSMARSLVESYKHSVMLSLRKSTGQAAIDAALELVSFIGTWLLASIFAFIGLMVSLIFSLHVVLAFGILVAYLAAITGIIKVSDRFEDWRLERRERVEVSL